MRALALFGVSLGVFSVAYLLLTGDTAPPPTPVLLCERVDGAHTCALLTPAGETIRLK